MRKLVAERNPKKTEVIYYVNDLDAAPLEWRIHEVQNMATLSTVTAGSFTLGVAVGPRQYIADQLLAKADVFRAMHERVQPCQDPQTEFALLRESVGPHNPSGTAAEIDEVGQRPLERFLLVSTLGCLPQRVRKASRGLVLANLKHEATWTRCPRLGRKVRVADRMYCVGATAASLFSLHAENQEMHAAVSEWRSLAVDPDAYLAQGESPLTLPCVLVFVLGRAGVAITSHGI